MTKREVLSFVRSIKPHDMEDEVMLLWLEELEKKVALELHGKQLCEARLAGFAQEQLSVPAPYDKIYWTYLVAMLELVKGTTESYQFANTVFREAYNDYAKHVQRRGGFGRRCVHV